MFKLNLNPFMLQALKCLKCLTWQSREADYVLLTFRNVVI